MAKRFSPGRKSSELGENLFGAKFRDFLLGENLTCWEKISLGPNSEIFSWEKISPAGRKSKFRILEARMMAKRFSPGRKSLWGQIQRFSPGRKSSELGENLFGAKFRDFLLGENLQCWEKNSISKFGS